jgi:hypothetical protein
VAGGPFQDRVFASCASVLGGPGAVASRTRGRTSDRRRSAKKDEVDKYIEIAGIIDLVDVTTSSDDAAESKPSPDIFEIVLKKLKIYGADAVAIGDTPYDAEAAGKANIPTIGVLDEGEPADPRIGLKQLDAELFGTSFSRARFTSLASVGKVTSSAAPWCRMARARSAGLIAPLLAAARQALLQQRQQPFAAHAIAPTIFFLSHLILSNSQNRHGRASVASRSLCRQPSARHDAAPGCRVERTLIRPAVAAAGSCKGHCQPIFERQQCFFALLCHDIRGCSHPG